jgi:superfamily I DNA and RNA helicase
MLIAEFVSSPEWDSIGHAVIKDILAVGEELRAGGLTPREMGLDSGIPLAR